MGNVIFLDDETKRKLEENTQEEINESLSKVIAKEIILKNCTCCNLPITSKTALFFGYSDYPKKMVWFNCPDCGSSMILKVA